MANKKAIRQVDSSTVTIEPNNGDESIDRQCKRTLGLIICNKVDFLQRYVSEDLYSDEKVFAIEKKFNKQSNGAYTKILRNTSVCQKNHSICYGLSWCQPEAEA